MKNSTLRLVNFAILSVLWLLLAAAAHGQSPSTSEPNPQALYGVNSKWTNGIAPGYYPTCSPGSCVGLTLNVGPGTCFDSSGTRHAYAGANLTMTNAATNYIYLDAACTVSQNTSGYIVGDIPVATVVTSGGNITTVTDDRTFFALRAIGYAIVESNGASVTSRGTLNLVNGTGASVSCVDNSGASRTDCTFSTTAVTGPTYGSQYCQAFTTGTVSSLACSTGTLTVTTGDVMFAACGTFTNDGGTKTISIADTQSTAWTQAVTYYSTSTGERLSIWWGVAGSTGADTFTCSLSAGSNGFWSLVVQQIVGANSSSPVDATGTGSQGTGSSMISNSLTTSSSNDLALVWAGTNNNDAGAVTLGGFAAFAPSALGNYLGVKTLQGSGTYTIQVVNVGTPWSNISVAIH